jgi:hypothetical protein
MNHNTEHKSRQRRLPTLEPDGNEAWIRNVRSTDVLLGRGQDLARFQGNVEFRNLIRQRREEYTSANLRSKKLQIAKEIVSTIARRDERFLSLVDLSTGSVTGRERAKMNKPQKRIGASVWTVAQDSVVLEKTMQALRRTCHPNKPIKPTSAATRNRKASVSGNAMAAASPSGVDLLQVAPGTVNAPKIDLSLTMPFIASMPSSAAVQLAALSFPTLPSWNISSDARMQQLMSLQDSMSIASGLLPPQRLQPSTTATGYK